MVTFARRSNRRTSRRYVYRRRRFGRGTFRLRSGFKRFYRRSGGSYRRRSFRKRTKRFRGTARGVKKFTAVQEWRSNAFLSDGGAGAAVRSFLLIGTQGSTTVNQNAQGTLPVGTTWGRHWRVPSVVYASGVVGVAPASSTLLGPYQTFTDSTGPSIANAFFCGISQNETFSIGELDASKILPWARMYKYVRIKKIHVKYVCKRTSPVVGYTSNIISAEDISTVNRLHREAPFLTGQRRGGDMVWLCTSRTGPIPDETVSDADITSPEGTWLKHTAYSEIRKNPQLRRKAVFRNDVAWGMRPVKFSFSPTCVVQRHNNAQTPLTGTGEVNETQGLMSADVASNRSRNPATALGYRYAKAGWWPMVMPQFGPKSDNTSGGAGSVAAGAASGQLVYLSTGGTYSDVTTRWQNAPLFGMFMGLQPTTAEVWPRNILRQTSFELEFKGLRNFETTTAEGAPFPYYKDWGNLPTARMY